MLNFLDFTALVVIYMFIVNICSSLDCYQCEKDVSESPSATVGKCTDAKDIGKLTTCKSESHVCYTQKTRKTVSTF